MKVVIIIILVIFYLSIGACIAAVEESGRYDKTGEYGLKPFIYIFWPLYVIVCWVKERVKKLKEREDG